MVGARVGAKVVASVANVIPGVGAGVGATVVTCKVGAADGDDSPAAGVAEGGTILAEELELGMSRLPIDASAMPIATDAPTNKITTTSRHKCNRHDGPRLYLRHSSESMISPESESPHVILATSNLSMGGTLARMESLPELVGDLSECVTHFGGAFVDGGVKSGNPKSCISRE